MTVPENATIAAAAEATAETGPSCRDCGMPFAADANFCPRCGQETRVRLPRVLDFLREAADETVGLSGRLPRTLGLLLFRPGRLTVEYIAGRRQRYVRPMRLYLSVSLVFFALLGVATSDIGWIQVPTFEDGAADRDLKDKADDKATKAETAKPAEAKTDAAAKPELPVVDLTPLDPLRKSVASAKPSAPPEAAAAGTPPPASTSSSAEPKSGIYSNIPWLDHRIERYKEMSRSQLIHVVAQGVQANAPYAVFILMPLAAFWYQLWYVFRRRRYAEHLLHAVHLHCFAFCIGTASLLPWVDGWRVWLFLLLGIYAILAERRVYGSGWIRASIGTFIGSVLYLIGVCFVATLLAILALAF